MKSLILKDIANNVLPKLPLYTNHSLSDTFLYCNFLPEIISQMQYTIYGNLYYFPSKPNIFDKNSLNIQFRFLNSDIIYIYKIHNTSCSLELINNYNKCNISNTFEFNDNDIFSTEILLGSSLNHLLNLDIIKLVQSKLIMYSSDSEFFNIHINICNIKSDEDLMYIINTFINNI